MPNMQRAKTAMSTNCHHRVGDGSGRGSALRRVVGRRDRVGVSWVVGRRDCLGASVVAGRRDWLGAGVVAGRQDRLGAGEMGEEELMLALIMVGSLARRRSPP